MIDVIIVDDEPLIREGLVKLFRWEDFQMQVRAVFSNGSLALEYLEKQPVDLIITDIKMPVMNGIELMQECLKRKYESKFIVLSGYSDFEYVKTAARLGIENYLLKPVDTQEMSQTLHQVRHKIQALRQDRVMLEEGLRILRNNLLYRLMTGKISYEEIEERKDYIHIPLRSSGYRVAILKFLPKDPAEILSATHRPPIQSIRRHLEEKDYINTVTDFSGRMLYLLFCGCADRKSEIQADLDNIINYVSATSLFYAYASIGFMAETIDTIPDSYVKASALINTAGYNSSVAIRWAEETVENEALLLPHVEFDQLMQLNEKFHYNNKEEIVSITDDIFHTNRYIPTDGLQMLTYMIVSKVYSNVRLYGSSPDTECTKIEKELEEAYTLTDYDSLHSWAHRMIDRIFSMEGDKTLSGTANIKKIIRYLDENYACDINLKTIADTFHLNALYLGRILKLETGCSFTDYINRLRIDRAQELLSHTDLSAKQIAEKVGYGNDKYFNTQFKKYTDMTPGEYRKEIIKS